MNMIPQEQRETRLADLLRTLSGQVCFDVNGEMGKGGNGGLTSDETLRTAGEAKMLLSRLGLLEKPKPVPEPEPATDALVADAPTADPDVSASEERAGRTARPAGAKGEARQREANPKESDNHGHTD